MKWIYIVNLIGLIMTVVGLITGYYFFLFLLLPLGFNFLIKKNNYD